MDILYRHNGLYIKYINDDKGWGVFTNEKIKKGQIIEQIYSIPINIHMKDFYDYFYEFNGTDTLLPLGFGCIYNHSDSENIHWKIIDKKKFIIEFIAVKDIEVGDELCHNYGNAYWINKNKKIL